MIGNINMTSDAKVRHWHVPGLIDKSAGTADQSTFLYDPDRKLKILRAYFVQVETSTSSTATVTVGTAADGDAYASITVDKTASAGTWTAGTVTGTDVPKGTPITVDQTAATGEGTGYVVLIYEPVDDDRTV